MEGLVTGPDPGSAGAVGRSLLRHSALYGLAGATGKAVALVTVPVLSRILSPSEYGLADLANSMAGMLVIVAMFAGDVPAARLLGRARTVGERGSVLSTYVWTAIVLGVVVGVALLPFVGTITGGLWDAPDRAGLALLSLLLIPVSAAQAALVTTQRLESRPKQFATLSTIDLLAQMLLAVLFAAIGGGATGMVAGFVLGSVVGLSAAAYLAPPAARRRPNVRLAVGMIREGFAFVPAMIGFTVANVAARYLLVQSEGQTAVGLFAVAIRMAGLMLLVSTAFGLAWGPLGLAQPAGERTARLFGRVMAAFSTLAVLSALALAAVGPELISVVSGDQYRAGSVMLPGLLLSAAMSGGFYVLLVAAGVSQRGRAVSVASVAGAILQVATTWVLLPQLHLQAVGVGALAGQSLALVLLVATIGSGVERSGWLVLMMCGGAVIALALQAASASPAATLVPRLFVLAVSSIAAATVGIRLLRTMRVSVPQPN